MLARRAGVLVIWGDAVMEYICAEWVRQSGGVDHHGTPEEISRLFDHPHDPYDFLDKRTGLPFLSNEVSGMPAFGPASSWE